MAEIIGGRHAVYHALKARARKVHQIWISRSIHRQALQQILQEAELQNIPVTTADKTFFAGHVPLETHQGIAAEVDVKPWTELEDLLVDLRQPVCRLILLDGIEDPQNLGALLRSALCLGADGVIDAAGTNATTCTPGVWNIEQMLRAADALPMNLGFLAKGNASLPVALEEQVKAARGSGTWCSATWRS